MRIDLHVHTNKYSECGKDSPDRMVQAAIRAGLDGIVFTEHNYQWSAAELAELRNRYPAIRLFRGIEVSITAEEHILVLGVPDAALFYPFMPPGEVMAAVGRYSGTAILAHPFRWSTSVRPDILTAGFHAIEVHSTSIRNYMQQPILSLQRQLNLPLVASSDGHSAEAMGLYAIDLKMPVADEKQLAAMVRQGQFTLWADERRIVALNARINRQREQLSRLLAQGISLPAAIREVGFSQHLVYPLSRKMDVLYPAGRTRS